MIDASIVPVPRQRNGREENAKIKAGETPEGWDDRPAKRRQKDTDARWTKKHGKSHYGYENHVDVDRRHKLIRRYTVTDTSVHDSRPLEDVLDDDNTASDVLRGLLAASLSEIGSKAFWPFASRACWPCPLQGSDRRPPGLRWADSAYRSAETEGKLAARGLRSRIHRKAHRNRPLSEREKQGNKTRSKVRARVEHVFGAQANDMGGTLLRCIGIARAKARIGLKNLAYNRRRAVHLDGIAAARAPT